MQRLINYVERLLLRHDCIVVPSFGAFLKESLAPRYRTEERRVYPGRERFSFNAAIKERDNLLEQEYARSYGISLRRARIMVDKEVEELQNTLFTTSNLSFGNLGAFSIGEDGKAIFSPTEEDYSILGRGDFYGLTSYSLPRTKEEGEGVYEAQSPEHARIITFQPQVAEEDKESPSLEKGKYLHFKIRKRTLATTAACLVLGGLLLSMPGTHSSHEKHYTAGFTPVEQTLQKEEQAPISVATSSPEEGSFPSAESPISKATASQEITSSYYVVIACFKTEGKVKEYISSLSEVSFASTLGYVPYGNRYAVYAFASGNKEEARDFAKSLRSSRGAFEKAWLLHQESEQ